MTNPKYRKHQMKKRYGITIEQYEELLVGQNGTCAICDEACSTGRRLAVDHDHDTGQIRGLLCYRCNTGLEWFTNPKRFYRATQYLAGAG